MIQLPKQTYTYTTKQFAIDQIIGYYNANRIDTDLDCQRRLVWTDQQKQDLIDTLIRRERIPEFHVIQEDYENIFHFADGKQRITTTLDFTNNKLKWYKSYASPEFYELFTHNLTFLYFKDLPKEWQNAILNSTLQFACYKDMTPKATTILFRKLNSGSSLSNFAKGLSSHITIKQYFLDGLIRHPVCDKIFSEAMINKDDAEQIFIRAYLLMKAYDESGHLQRSLDLRAGNLETYYLDVESASDEQIGQYLQELNKYYDIIKSFLDRLNTFEDTIEHPLRTKKNFPLLFTLYYTYIYNYNDTNFELLYRTLNQLQAYTIVGAGADYSESNIKTYMSYIVGTVFPQIGLN